MISELSFQEIQVGDTASFKLKIEEEHVFAFASLTGDYNPLHTDSGYAATTRFGRCIAHGMFLGSLFSRLVGMYLPGRHCLYLSQTLNFLKPVYVGDEIEVVGEVYSRHEAVQSLVMKTELYVLPDQLAVSGKAHVMVLE